MKELEILVDNLKDYLAKKELELSRNPNFNSYTAGHLRNRQRDIESFESACKNCETNSFEKIKLIDSFKKDASKIKLDIDNIT
jgi:hypothetical protein